MWMLGAGALGRPRGMVWGGSREEGSGWGAHVYPLGVLSSNPRFLDKSERGESPGA